jgi:hypothetical protein
MSKPKTVELGQRFGTLVVISEPYSYKQRMACDCKCDCSTIGRRALKDLLTGKSKNCGCLRGPRLKSIASVQRENHPCFKGYGEIHAHIWSSYKANAKQRNIPFEITIEQAWELFLKQNRTCSISGIPIKFANSRELYVAKTASLDRIDSTKGYSIDNIHWVHKEINFMKHKCPLDKFFEWCRMIIKYQDELLAENNIVK